MSEEKKELTDEELNNIAGGGSTSVLEACYNWFIEHEEYLIEANKILKIDGKEAVRNYLNSIIESHSLPNEWKNYYSFYALSIYKTNKGV